MCDDRRMRRIKFFLLLSGGLFFLMVILAAYNGDDGAVAYVPQTLFIANLTEIDSNKSVGSFGNVEPMNSIIRQLLTKKIGVLKPSPFEKGTISHIPTEEVVIVVVVCGRARNVVDNGMILIKSAILFSRGVKLRVIVYKDGKTDQGQAVTIDDKLKEYVEISQKLGLYFSYEVLDSTFPDNDGVDWRNFYMTCTTQRLFIASTLPSIDAVLYLDADTIFLSSVKDLWDLFHKMNDEQVMGMIYEHEPPGDGWYNTKAEHPYYGPRGLNGGVALMNLTRLRKIGFEREVTGFFKEYEKLINYADQDLMNIFFAKHPNMMYDVPCGHNYRVGHCVCAYESGNCECKDAEENGASIVHGNHDGFLKEPLQTVHNHFNKFDLAKGNPWDLVKGIEDEWEDLERDAFLSSHFDPDDNMVESTSCLKNVKGKLLIKFKNYLNQSYVPKE